MEPPEYEKIIIRISFILIIKVKDLQSVDNTLKKCLWCETTLGWLHRQLHMNMNETACYDLRCSLKGKIPLRAHPPSVWSAALITRTFLHFKFAVFQRWLCLKEALLNSLRQWKGCDMTQINMRNSCTDVLCESRWAVEIVLKLTFEKSIFSLAVVSIQKTQYVLIRHARIRNDPQFNVWVETQRCHWLNALNCWQIQDSCLY